MKARHHLLTILLAGLLSVLLLAGSHGAEHWTPADGTRHPAAGEPTAAERAERDRLRAEAEALVAGVPGAWIEPKTFGFAVPSRTVAADERAELHARVDALMAAQAKEMTFEQCASAFIAANSERRKP